MSTKDTRENLKTSGVITVFLSVITTYDGNYDKKFCGYKLNV